MSKRVKRDFWKHFLRDTECILQWFAQMNIEGGHRSILATIVMILRGETDTYKIFAAVFESASICDAVLYETKVNSNVTAVPDNPAEIIQRWICFMPKEDTTIGWAYEKLSIGRRGKGLYYTPPNIIDFILKHTVESVDLLKNPSYKILDPACGCGFFLLRAYDILYDKYQTCRDELFRLYPEKDWSDTGIHRHILTYNLWGADIDPIAAEVAAAGLLLKNYMASSKLSANIANCDSLIKTDALTAGFDCIIGNPPYISYGLRGSGKLPDEYRDYLREVYQESAEYKISYYSLFIQRSIELLQEHGHLGFIIPDSFLLGRYFSKIRNYILENTDINLIVHIEDKIFANAVTGYSVIIILTKCCQDKLDIQQGIDIYQINDIKHILTVIPSCQYSQQYFDRLSHKRFRVFFDMRVKELVDYIDKLGKSLGIYASGHSGIRSKTRQADIIRDQQPKDSMGWCKGLASGSQVTRYNLHYDGHWILIDPEKLYKGGWDETLVKQKKILIRQTGFSLIACIDTEGYYHLNNIHSFSTTSDLISPEYLLILLNSRLMAFYYHATSMEYGRSMAQTNIETIELLPICYNAEINQQAAQIVATMKGSINKSSTTAFNEYVNQLVYRIYDLNYEQIRLVEEYEQNLADRYRRCWKHVHF